MNPPPTSLEDRKAILTQVGFSFGRSKIPAIASTIHLYRGSRLSPELIEEAFGASHTALRQYRQDIFFNTGATTKKWPLFSQTEGRMEPTNKNRQHHLYVWQYFPAGTAENKRSIFRLSGMTTTGARARDGGEKFKGFNTDRNMVFPSGSDSLIIESGSILTRYVIGVVERKDRTLLRCELLLLLSRILLDTFEMLHSVLHRSSFVLHRQVRAIAISDMKRRPTLL